MLLSFLPNFLRQRPGDDDLRVRSPVCRHLQCHPRHVHRPYHFSLADAAVQSIHGDAVRNVASFGALFILHGHVCSCYCCGVSSPRARIRQKISHRSAAATVASFIFGIFVILSEHGYYETYVFGHRIMPS